MRGLAPRTVDAASCRAPRPVRLGSYRHWSANPAVRVWSIWLKGPTFF